jgi:hypothetical protein
VIVDPSLTIVEVNRTHREVIMRVAKVVVGVAVFGGLLVGAAPTVGNAAPAGGPIRVFVTPGSGAAGTILITGAIGDYGKTITTDQNGNADSNGNYARNVLKKGSFLADLTALNAAANSQQPTLNTDTCSGFFSVRGPVTLSKGTGAYKGISGTLQVTETFAFVFPRYTGGARKGQCTMGQDAEPAAQYGSVTGSGTVSFG